MVVDKRDCCLVKVKMPCMPSREIEGIYGSPGPSIKTWSSGTGTVKRLIFKRKFVQYFLGCIVVVGFNFVTPFLV